MWSKEETSLRTEPKTRRGFVIPLAFNSRGSFRMRRKEFLVFGVQAGDERFNQ